jgi:branched-chain amino acid transport system permease protein
MVEFLQTVINAVSLGSLYALISLGVALVFGVMGLINFAHAQLLMIAGYLMATIGTPELVAVAPAVLVVVALSAVLMERIAFRPMRNASPVTLLVSSFALSSLLQNVAGVIFGFRTRAVEVSTTIIGTIDFAGLQVSTIDLVTILVAGVLLAGVTAFLLRTDAGIQIRAAAEDFVMAGLLGVRANRVIATAFAISGLLAGAAGFLLTSQTGAITPTAGIAPVLLGFVATVLGGMRSLPGAALGGFLLGAVTVVLQTYLPSGLTAYRDAFVFGAVIVVLLVRPQGLFGSTVTMDRAALR